MKNLIKGLGILSFVALSACQQGFEAQKGLGLSSGSQVNIGEEITPEVQHAVTATQENVTKMEVNVDDSLKQLDTLFASMQQQILANTANMSSSGGGLSFGNILGTIGSILLGGFNPISLITTGISLVSNLVNGFSGGSQPAVFTDFQSAFNDIFSNVQVIVGQAKAMVNDQRQVIVAKLATLDSKNPAQAALYQQLMNVMSQLDMADQKIISKVDNFNTRAQAFMQQVNAIQQHNSSSGIGAMAGSFLQNFQGIIGQAIQGLFNIL